MMIRKKKRGSLKPYTNTLLIDLNHVLATRNVAQASTLFIRMGISKNSTTKLLRGDAVQVTLRQLTSICYNLNCTPNDIFVVRDLPLPEGHALHSIRKHDPAAQEPNFTDWAASKSVAEIAALMKE